MLGYLMMFGLPGIGALVFGAMFLWNTIKQSRVASGIAALACMGLCVSAFWPISGSQQSVENAAGKQAKKTQVSRNRKPNRRVAMPPMRIASSTRPGNQPIANGFLGTPSVPAAGTASAGTAGSGVGVGRGSHTPASQPQDRVAARSVSSASARAPAPPAKRAFVQSNAPAVVSAGAQNQPAMGALES